MKLRKQNSQITDAFFSFRTGLITYFTTTFTAGKYSMDISFLVITFEQDEEQVVLYPPVTEHGIGRTLAVQYSLRYDTPTLSKSTLWSGWDARLPSWNPYH